MEIEAEKTDNGCDFSGERKPEPPVVYADDEKNSFYEKLSKLNDSSGLSLVFNVPVETKFDLHRLYKEVTKRGGFYQVMKDEKWGEVESALNLLLLPAQLQKVYEIHLLHFEHAYRKMTDQSNPCPDTASPGPWSFQVAQSCSKKGKRKHPQSSSPLFPYSGCKTVNPNQSMIGSLNSMNKELKKGSEDPPPMKPRIGYHIFLRLESHRLRMIHGENFGNQKIRNMAIQAWKSLSDKDKKPYIDASKMDKERYEREMAEFNKCRGNNENANNSDNGLRDAKICEKRDDCYKVSLQQKADYDDIVAPDESMVELAVAVMKNAGPNDIDW